MRQPDWVDIDSIGRFADMRFINWSDVESIVVGGHGDWKKIFSKEFFTAGNFFLSGKVIDFSPEKESDNYFYGVIGHKELLANLAYSSEKEFKDVFFPAINKMSKEYDIPLLVRESEKGYTHYSNDKNNDAIKAYEKCVSSVFKEVKLFVYLGLGGLAIIIFLLLKLYFGTPFAVLVLAIAGYFTYKKFKAN